MQLNKKEALVLAQKVIGLANMGLLASDRIVDEARSNMQALEQAGECIAPEAAKALNALKMRALPGQALCHKAKDQLNDFLAPILAEARAERVRQRNAAAPVERQRG
jgi:hypothetical protein